MARSRMIRTRGKKRLSTWFSIDFDSTTFTVAGGSILSSLNAAALALRPFTVVRTHLEVMMISDQAAAVEFQAGAIGLSVVSDQASAAGVSSVPTPVTDIGSDLWFVHQVLYSDESNLTDRTRNASRYSIDSKAMRRVDGDQDIVIVGELSATGSGFVLFTAGRMLIKTN